MLNDGIELIEGSSIVNATVASGPNFPSLPSTGELFYRTSATIGMYFYNGDAWTQFGSGSASGSVTSVGLSATQGIIVTGSPVTSSGTFSLSLGNIAPTGVSATGNVTTTGTFFDSAGVELGYKTIPKSSTTSGTVPVGDRGKCLPATGGITVPSSIFSAGDVFTVYNTTGGNITLTQAAGLTMYLVGTATTGNRTLATHGLATIWFNSASECVIAGAT